MAIASRSDKGGGRANWQTGDTIAETPFEADFDNAYDQLNGNIDSSNLANGSVTNAKLANNAVKNANVDAAAGIAVAKLDQTAGQLDADIVDDFWATTAESKTATDPGTQDSVSAPTNLEEEIARQRYVMRRLAVGAGTLISTGAQAAAWYDGCAIGPNLLVNSSFVDNSTSPAAPFGWTLVGTPNGVTPTTMAAQRAEGIGRYLVVADAAGTGGAANEGIQQTMVGLKASTLYLVEARVLPTTSVVKLVTTGAAAGTFTDLALSSASGTGAWETLSGLVWTDNTPTNLVIRLLSNASDYSFGLSSVTLREVASPAAAATNEHEGTTSRDGGLIKSTTSTQSGLANGAAITTFLGAMVASVVVPGPGYQIKVGGFAHFTDTGNFEVTVSLQQDVDSAGTWPTVQDSSAAQASGGGTVRSSIPISYALLAPTPGSLYSYRLSVVVVGGTPDFDGSATRLHRLTVELVRTSG